MKTHMQVVHRDGFKLNHKLDTSRRISNSPQREHEVIYVITRCYPTIKTSLACLF